MNALVIHKHGGPEVLTVEHVPTPAPATGEGLVRVGACALNGKDIWARTGPPGGRPTFPWKPRAFPFIGGGDAAGTVEEVGPSGGGWKQGDRGLIPPILSCGPW